MSSFPFWPGLHDLMSATIFTTRQAEMVVGFVGVEWDREVIQESKSFLLGERAGLFLNDMTKTKYTHDSFLQEKDIFIKSTYL